MWLEIKIPKEVRQHKETIFFGLSARQFLCALLAVGIAAAGFFHYNGLTLEQFVWAFLKSQVLCAGIRVFRSENIYYKALGRKEDRDFD